MPRRVSRCFDVSKRRPTLRRIDFNAWQSGRAGVGRGFNAWQPGRAGVGRGAGGTEAGPRGVGTPCQAKKRRRADAGRAFVEGNPIPMDEAVGLDP